jgi:hypothetical protein
MPLRSFFIQKMKGEDKYYLYFSDRPIREVHEKGIECIKPDCEVNLETLKYMRDAMDKMIRKVEEGI